MNDLLNVSWCADFFYKQVHQRQVRGTRHILGMISEWQVLKFDGVPSRPDELICAFFRGLDPPNVSADPHTKPIRLIYWHGYNF